MAGGLQATRAVLGTLAGSSWLRGARPRKVYHLTFSDFPEFKVNWGDDEWRRVGFHVGSAKAANNRMALKLAEDAASGERSGNAAANIIPLYTNIKRPLFLGENRTGRWGVDDIYRQVMEEAESGKNRQLNWISPEEIDDFYSDLHILRPEANERVFADPFEWSSGERTDELLRWLGEAGFDSIGYKNKFEGGGNSYLLFDPASVKSAISNTGEMSKSSGILHRAQGGLAQLRGR